MTPPVPEGNSPNANPWHDRAEELARWAMLRLVNRTDRCGRYFFDAEAKLAKPFASPKSADDAKDGHVSHVSLLRHFRATDTGAVVGVYCYGRDRFGKWACIDIDAHDETADTGANERYALHAYQNAVATGLCPLLYESNGKGGFHLWLLFDGAVVASVLKALGNWLVRDSATFGFAKPPEVFPKNDGATEWGNWVRMPGRHHTRDVWPRVWNGSAWLTGDDAVAHILALSGCDPDVIPTEAAAFGVEVQSGGSAQRKERPADMVPAWEDFNQRATLEDVSEILMRHGWTRARSRGDGAIEFVRPGKGPRGDQGGNLLAKGGPPLFYCFTDAAPPLKTMTAYAPAALVATLDHRSDFKASNSKLYEMGFGTREVKRKKPSDPIQPPTEPALVTPGTELILTPLAGKKVRPVNYLVPGRVPLGKLILCAGRGGDGKSTLWRSIAADLSVGRCVLGLNYDKPIRAKSIIVAAEDGPEDTILPGLLAEGADVSRIAILEGVRRAGKRCDFTLAPEHVELVRQRLVQSPEIKLVILDPIASFVGRAKIDDHRASELRLLLDPLSALAESAGVTIVMIAHLNKSTGDAVDRIAGSAAYRDTVRAAYLVCQDPDDEARRFFMPIKDNLPGFQRSTIPFFQVPLTDAEAAVILSSEQFKHLTGDDREAARTQLRRIRFDAPQSVDPNDAMKAKKADGAERPVPERVKECATFVRKFLGEFAWPDSELIRAATGRGFDERVLMSAKAILRCSEGTKEKLPDDCSTRLSSSNYGRGKNGEWWQWIGPKRNPKPDRPIGNEFYEGMNNTTGGIL